MARQVFAFLADNLVKPSSDVRRAHIVVVNPVLVPGIVRRVDVDALYLARVVGQQRAQGFQIVSLHHEIARVRIAR